MDQMARRVRGLNALESAVVFVPVIITWTRLFFASRDYLAYVRATAAASDDPDILQFFQAWQTGFAGRGETFQADARGVVLVLVLVAIAVSICEWQLSGTGQASSPTPVDPNIGRGSERVRAEVDSSFERFPEVASAPRRFDGIPELESVLEGLRQTLRELPTALEKSTGSYGNSAAAERLLVESNELATLLDRRFDDLQGVMTQLVVQLAEVAIELKRRPVQTVTAQAQTRDGRGDGRGPPSSDARPPT